MTSDFLLAFDREIALVSERLERERRALSTEQERGESQRLRVRVQYVEKLLTRLKSDRSAIRGASSQIDEMEKRFLRWSEICAEARTLEDAMHRAEKELAAAREACIPAENAVAFAEREWQQQKAAKLPQFPTEPEVRRARDAEHALQRKYHDALAELRARARERDSLQVKWMDAAAKFDNACFRERMARLPQEDRPFEGVGKLSAVG